MGPLLVMSYVMAFFAGSNLALALMHHAAGRYGLALFGVVLGALCLLSLGLLLVAEYH